MPVFQSFPRRMMCCTLLVALSGCDQGGAPRSGIAAAATASALTARLDTVGGVDSAAVVVRGFSRDELAALRSATTADSVLRSVIRVAVDDSVELTNGASMAVATVGRYHVTESGVTFRPRFPFDAGRTYRITLDPRALPTPRTESRTIVRLALAAGDRTPRTHVTALYPSGDTVPENLLRVYIEFSGPMSRTGGLPYISLRDERDAEVKNAFLPLDADFWNSDRTRYTAFFDPGRVKRGILPNEQMGRAIRAGRRYSIVVDSAWRDDRGVPLTGAFRWRFAVRAPDERTIDVNAWRIDAPHANSRDALVVAFPKALDRGLLQRAVGVQSANGETVDGNVVIARHETEWRFTPRANWTRGTYQLVVLSMLEDAAGNRTDHPFEVDMFDRVDKSATPERRLMPFSVR
jgi:hypothetical protein